MYYFLLGLLCPFIVHGAALRLEQRQVLGISSSNPPPKLKAFKIEEIPARTNIPGAKGMRIIYGPFKIQAANVSTSLGNSKSMDKGDSSYMNMVDDDFPRDITILTSESEVQTKEFKRATTTEGIYNHHNVFMDVSKPPLSVYGCSDPKLQQKSTSFPFSLLAGGATETAISQFSTNKGDVKAGYYLSKTRIIITIVDVVNYKNETQDIYTVTDLEYLLGKPEGYLDSNQQRIDPGICGGPQGSAIHAPAGVSKFSINSTGIIMKESGWILNSFAHMHDGGVNIVLKINDKVMCDSRALYGGDGFVTTTSDGKVWETIRETTKCVDPIPVRKGDRMDMQANYDTDLHPSRSQGGGHGGMSMRMSNMKLLNSVNTPLGGMDGGDAEQMALVVTYFAATKN